MSSFKEESISKGETDIKKETSSTGDKNPLQYNSKNSNEQKGVNYENIQNKKI